MTCLLLVLYCTLMRWFQSNFVQIRIEVDRTKEYSYKKYSIINEMSLLNNRYSE